MRRAGFTLLEVLIALALLAVGSSLSLGFLAQSRNARLRGVESALASTAATELLEFFRSFHTGDALLTFLAGRPIKYPLCSRVHFKNWATGVLQQPDALAGLPPTALGGAAVSLAANRYYQVHIMDIDTLAVQPARCGQVPGALVPPTLAANERVFVTVAVDWKSRSDSSTVEQKALTAVLPE